MFIPQNPFLTNCRRLETTVSWAEAWFLWYGHMSLHCVRLLFRCEFFLLNDCLLSEVKSFNQTYHSVYSKVYLMHAPANIFHGNAEVLLMLFYCFPSQKHAYIILTPLKSHFYIVKLGFTGVYIILLISA